MSTAQVLLAAAAEGGEEKSHLAFYLAGGITAAFAVIVSIIGIQRPSFPATKGQQSAVTALAVAVVAASMATIVLTA